VNLIIHYDSEFCFTVDRSDNADGTAAVRYQMGVNDGRLPALIAQYNGISGQQLSMIRGIGPFLGMGAKFTDLQRISGSYDDGTVVRQGRIKGQLKGGRLHLEWAGPAACEDALQELARVRDEAGSAWHGSGASIYAPSSEEAVPSGVRRYRTLGNRPVTETLTRTEDRRSQ